RQPAVGISFFLNDFISPQRIRSESSGVFNLRSWARINELGSGVAIHYFQGLFSHMDFAGTFAGSFVKNVLPNETAPYNSLLLEGDVSVHLKMSTEQYLFTPFLSIGVGASE